MVEQMLADVARVDDRGDTVFGQLAGGTDAAEHEQLGALEDPLGEDNFAGGVEVDLAPRRSRSPSRPCTYGRA